MKKSIKSIENVNVMKFTKVEINTLKGGSQTESKVWNWRVEIDN